ncbi:MAG: LysR family transcriptional regulator [Paludibacterium sp.]|uniref:LysR family transcriptional regulator n=1 Tax=Paludibacterium sp. TaxID=1917523 RepID=UPI0025D47D30|nr:LysR family transcriptional regulator [Paludibacterium sp.]MBV8049519.1 LysR family transcriptional regulator [Paludibacterium sp.]MBV8646220.1 LysR family transcriptional regulator [Paludibacterium sp.]
MEIYQLRTFVTVAQQGHLTQAAEQLHLSQPAVTAQIKALEEEVGLPLFERTAGGVTLTLAGQELLPRAQSILASARQLVDHARGLKGQPAGLARIGTSLSPDWLRVGPWVARLTQRYPLLDLRLSQGVTIDVLNKVRKHEFEAGFFLGKNPYANVNSILLCRLPFVLAMPCAWRERLDGGQIRELGKLPWIGLSQFSSFHRLTSELWRELSIAPRKVAECDHLDTLVSLVTAGVGVGLLREEIALGLEAEGALYVVPGVRKRYDLQFIYPADRESDPVIRLLLDTLNEVWQLHDPEVLGHR